MGNLRIWATNYQPRLAQGRGSHTFPQSSGGSAGYLFKVLRFVGQSLPILNIMTYSRRACARAYLRLARHHTPCPPPCAAMGLRPSGAVQPTVSVPSRFTDDAKCHLPPPSYCYAKRVQNSFHDLVVSRVRTPIAEQMTQSGQALDGGCGVANLACPRITTTIDVVVIRGCHTEPNTLLLLPVSTYFLK